MSLVGQSRIKCIERLNQERWPSLYLPKREIFEEPAGIKNAPYIIDTLDVHKIKRKKNYQDITFFEFYCLMKKLFILTFIKNLVI